MVTVIVSDEQRTLCQVAFGQPLNLNGFGLRATRQLFSIINKELPAVMLILCYATAYLVSATMDCNLHLSNILIDNHYLHI